MKSEKRFLCVFLSAALILCSLRVKQHSAISAVSTEAFMKPIESTIGTGHDGPVATEVHIDATVGNVTAKCGETVIVPLELDSIHDIASVKISLPNGITCKQVVDNNGNKLELINVNSTVEFNMFDSTVFITYIVDENILAGDYDIEYDILGRMYVNPYGGLAALPVYDIIGGKITVNSVSQTTVSTAITTSITIETTTVTTTGNELPIVPIKPVKGDANGDGVLRVSDAACIAKNLAEASINSEQITAEEYPAMDYNQDGKVTAADAAAIAKYLAEQSINK